ncbi:flagellar type III secretion system pore protein FliP [Actinokineospora globicatena]|uniref:flagellar type III secretion system pore protein FliP n=1 Tax=Actinokineospora globicatena TaxID=103729 RepID=UPI0020A483FB|nr:flagellar type III secretion system pore protein FliP [Actinokineospora globicatena]MCP2306211.1 flagellar biosynthetic protein FliP [Actinokineospora globicatena]GLW81637.1 flagellar biosynthetic protein FliP [Actinokineospora globicatena]GLW88431.1 flagellar biosynthetic protein FliP [Actinokineospora globicatena]
MRSARPGRFRRSSVLALLVVLIGLLGATGSASAQPGSAAAPVAVAQPSGPTGPTEPNDAVTVTVGTPEKPSESIVILLLLTTLSVAPSLLLLCTSFTKVFVVLSITRNALGLTNVPPNQVLAGLALFLSLFIMGPVVSEVNAQGVQPYLNGEKSQSVAFTDGMKPLREFMLKQTRPEEIALFTKVAGDEKPATAADVPTTTLIPAFVLSELRAAMLIGFVLFIPFLVIDMVVSASLMSLGMMMLPPVTVALPFKLLLFVLANGWGLLITALVGTYS